ncbi:MAG: HAD-IC family P-type ATPase [Bacteroidales bacterium]|nr:HAD-IC family P-type ATPase [Bacteroidales bacterium]
MDINQNFPWHSIDAEDAIKRLKSDKNGLDHDERQKRLRQFGENKLEEKGKASILSLIFKQFKDFLVYVLLAAALISYFAGHSIDFWVIIGVIIVNATIGFFQEYKAEKSIESLKKLLSHEASIMENGERSIVDVARLVPGDILLLDEGKAVPADGRIIRSKNLQVVEASLTGESLPAGKTEEALDEDTPLADRKNMVYKGTHVARGSCKVVVSATAEKTELGKIAESLKEVGEKESRFRTLTAQIAKIMAGIAVVTAIIVFIVGYFIRDFGFEESLLVTIATMVSSIPEGLPAVLSVVLAIGANRMAKQNAIIREFTATETAGSLNVILSDKTGTITQGILTIKKIFIPGNDEYTVTGEGYEMQGEVRSGGSEVSVKDKPLLAKSILIAGHCNDAGIKQENEDKDKEPEVAGDPTEAAMLVLCKKTCLKEESSFKDIEVLDDLPFNPEKKFRASLISYPDESREMLFVGAPEKILSLSSKFITEKGDKKLDHKTSKEVNDKIDELSNQSMRVIGCAYKPADSDRSEVRGDDAESLVFVGLYGIIDPPRPEVKDAVAKCKTAGIRVIMVTGDHKQTAMAIAREVGIIEAGEEEKEDCPLVLTGQDLDVDDATLDKYTACTNVFARVSPDAKLRIARSVQGKELIIGMTGDGVNDAPALKVADLGIAMGQRGTDVARDNSQIVLSDDNFASIINAIEEGRIVFRNIRLTTFFLITTNFASTLNLVAALAIGFTYPLSPTQILWINLVTDGVMDISLATEPGNEDLMKEPPVKKSERIINKEILPNLLIIVPVMVVLALLTFSHYRPDGVEKARTGAFLVVAMTQIFNAFNLRSLKKSAFTIGFFRNKWLILAFFVSIALQLAAIKLPFMQGIFKFRDLPWIDILVITLLSSLVFVFGELYKFIRRRLQKV